MCTSFKQEILEATHNFGTAPTRAGTGADTFKLALYTSSASFTDATTAYTATNEVSASGTYSTGGGALTIGTPPTRTGTTAFLGFSTLTFTSATITAAGALIYNDTQAGDPTVCVLDFGGDKTSTAGDFSIIFPTADATSAIIRITA